MESDIKKLSSMSAMSKYIAPVAAIAFACAAGLPLIYRYWKSYDMESKANPSIAAKVDKLYAFTINRPLNNIDRSFSMCEDGTLNAICSDSGMSRYVFGILTGNDVFLTYIPALNSRETFFLAKDSYGDGINEYDDFYETSLKDYTTSNATSKDKISSFISPEEYAAFNATYEKHLDTIVSILEKKSSGATVVKFPRIY